MPNGCLNGDIDEAEKPKEFREENSGNIDMRIISVQMLFKSQIRRYWVQIDRDEKRFRDSDAKRLEYEMEPSKEKEKTESLEQKVNQENILQAREENILRRQELSSNAVGRLGRGRTET